MEQTQQVSKFRSHLFLINAALRFPRSFGRIGLLLHFKCCLQPIVYYGNNLLTQNTHAVVLVPDFLLVPNVNTVGSRNSLQGALSSSTESQSSSGINTATANGVAAAIHAHDSSV